MKDLTSRADVVLLVDTFYGKVREDEVLGPLFNTIIGDRWPEHLQLLHSFWSSVLLGEASYRNYVIQRHIEVNKQWTIEDRHSERWLALWRQTVTELFQGENADIAYNRAGFMMQMIRMKIDDYVEGKTLM